MLLPALGIIVLILVLARPRLDVHSAVKGADAA